MTPFEQNQAKLAGEILRALKPQQVQEPIKPDVDKLLKLAETNPAEAKRQLDQYESRRTDYLLSKPPMALTEPEKKELIGGICDFLRENGYVR
jgi:hypothetical protein